MSYEPTVEVLDACASNFFILKIYERGAHLLVQTRVKTRNRALGTVCKRWYPRYGGRGAT